MRNAFVTTDAGLTLRKGTLMEFSGFWRLRSKCHLGFGMTITTLAGIIALHFPPNIISHTQAMIFKLFGSGESTQNVMIDLK